MKSDKLKINMTDEEITGLVFEAERLASTKVDLEELAIQAEYLANTSMCLTSAMFDSDLGPTDFEMAMRFFAENMQAYSTQINFLSDTLNLAEVAKRKGLTLKPDIAD